MDASTILAASKELLQDDSFKRVSQQFKDELLKFMESVAEKVDRVHRQHKFAG